MAELPDCWTMPIPLSRWAELDMDIDDDIDKSGQGAFYILATIEFTWSEVDEEGAEKDDGELRSVELILPRDLVLDESWGRLMLTGVLSASKVPARDHQSITEAILSRAHSMARDDLDGHARVLPMLAFITCPLDSVGKLNVPVVLGPIWKRRSIKGLRKVKIEGEAVTCSICLGDLPPGSVAAALPCSHVYHDHCVFTWVIQGGSCPLCRSPSGRNKIIACPDWL